MNSNAHESVVALHPSPEFEEFRDILLGSEKAALSSLDQRVEEIREPVAIGDRLPAALAHSVKSDRAEMAAALSPILGPAIRLYVNQMFKGLIAQMNETIQNATSLKRYRWRFEAKRAGIPYPEYVLLKSLNYQIDEVFLIDPKSGLLMERVSRETGDTPLQRDPDLVSGMISAIRSFAKETLAHDRDAELARFSAGDYEVFVEVGPHAILAAIGTGVPSANYRNQMTEALERLENDMGEELEVFSGNYGEFPNAEPEMRGLLVENRAEEKPTSMWPVWATVTGVVAAICLWAGFSIQREATWERGLHALRNAPGIEVVEVGKSGSQRIFHLMKDPAAAMPMGILTAEIGELSEKATFRETPYLSLEPVFQEARERKQSQELDELRANLAKAEAALNAKIAGEIETTSMRIGLDLSEMQKELERKSEVDAEQLTEAVFRNRFGHSGATIQIEDGIWKVAGEIREPVFSAIKAESESMIMDGGAVDFSGLKKFIPKPMKPEFQVRSEAIEAVKLVFPSGEPHLTPGLEIEMETVAGKMENMDVWCLETGRKLPFYQLSALPVVGENLDENRDVERQRLNHLKQFLTTRGISEARISTKHERKTDPERTGLIVRVVKESGG